MVRAALSAKFSGECPVSLLRGSPKITNFRFTPGGNSSRVNAVAVTVNGGIFAAGSNYFADEDVSRLVVSCFTSNGQFDFAFCDAGVQTNIFNSNARKEANGLFFQPDNRLIVTGYSGTDTINSFATVRYLTAGF